MKTRRQGNTPPNSRGNGGGGEGDGGDPALTAAVYNNALIGRQPKDKSDREQRSQRLAIMILKVKVTGCHCCRVLHRNLLNTVNVIIMLNIMYMHMNLFNYISQI